MSKTKWYQTSYRRNLVDMHIEDWDEMFLSKLDPEKYVSLLKKAKVQTAMVYANSHVGLCNWPTKNGVMHRGLKGKDFLGEMIERCHKEGMDVVVYFTLIYDNWAYDQNPSSRIINQYECASRVKSEEVMFSGGRYGNCCPNNNWYRDYVCRQVQELCERYDFEGMFLDMTFWPTICYCPACQQRFQDEVGGELPKVINWKDEQWISFQRKREKWLAEFAYTITNAIKTIKPEVTVEHQFAPAPSSWRVAVTEGVCQASDYAGGDFYGGILQQSFICKLYHSLTRNEPFEYMTSRCDPNLRFHTNTKSKEALELHTYIALAHNGAFLFIDAIDPIGSLQSKLYEIMGEIFSKSQKYEQFLGGKLCRDVAVYFSLTSKINHKYDGKKPMDDTEYNQYPHVVAALRASETLRHNNIPFSVISKSNLRNIDDCQVLVLPNINLIDEEEATCIRKFVEKGGSLYVSGYPEQPILLELLGFEYQGETKEKFTYIAPVSADNRILKEIDKDSPLTVDGGQYIVSAVNKNEVVATITLPYTDPSDTTKFVSIHSNPPVVNTDYPSIIYRSYGRGRVIWSAAAIEATEAFINRQVFLGIINELLEKPVYFLSNAPAPVEIVMFDQPENKRYIISAINEQEHIPVVAVHELTISVKLNGKKAIKAELLPERQPLNYEVEVGYVKISLPKLDLFHMLALYYE